MFTYRPLTDVPDGTYLVQAVIALNDAIQSSKTDPITVTCTVPGPYSNMTDTVVLTKSPVVDSIGLQRQAGEVVMQGTVTLATGRLNSVTVTCTASTEVESRDDTLVLTPVANLHH